jgi:hypothetical protein
MEKFKSLIRVVCFVSVAASLSACGGGEGGQPAVPSPGKSERLSPSAKCLRQHPALQVKSFPSSAAAVEAFFRATVECRPTEAEVNEFAAWMDAKGVKIENPEGAR